jgi:outer membrane protein TolC
MGFTIHGVIILALLGGPRLALADTDELRLTDVISAAVRHSPELERARIDVEASRASLLRAAGGEDLHVGATASWDATHAASSDPLGGGTAQRVTVSAGRTLSTGGTLSVITTGDRQTNSPSSGEAAAGAVAGQRYAASVVVKLVQPLLRGAGAMAFEAPIRQAAQQRDAAILTQEARGRDLVVSLVQAYWQVAFAWRQLEVRKASLELAQQQLAYTTGMIRAEKVAGSEALAVQAAIAIRKQDVIASEQELYERSLALRQLGGLEIGPEALLVKTEALAASVSAGELDIPTVVRGAFDHSPELAAAAATRQAAETGEEAAAGDARSRLDLDLAGGPIGADTRPAAALASALSHPGYTIFAQLTFDHAIERRAERGGEAAARAVVLAARVAEREARARLAVRATRAVQRAKAALARLALGAEAISLAEQNVAGEQRRFELGKSTNFDVLRRHDELEQARLRHAAAVADYLAARADLDGLDGTILGRFGIVMP